MKLIGIAGCDGSGKTTLAESLREIYGDKEKSVHINFADKLKDEVAALLTFADTWKTEYISTDEGIEVYSDLVREKPTPEWLRLLLRGWGNYRRSGDPKYWVNRWIDAVVDHKYQCDFELKQECFVVCSDVRYVNEAKAIHELGGTLLYLDDVCKPLGELTAGELHELDKVAAICDYGFLINTKARGWVKADYVAKLLGL